MSDGVLWIGVLDERRRQSGSSTLGLQRLALTVNGEPMEQEQESEEQFWGRIRAMQIEEAGSSFRSAQHLADVIKLPEPSNPEHALASIPLIRHWLFAPDGTKLRFREVSIPTIYKGRCITQVVRIGDRFAGAGQGYGILTTRHQRAIFILQELWQKQGGRLALVNDVKRGTVCASSWELEEMLFGSHGGRQKRMVRAIIQELASIPVEVKNYIGPDGEVQDIDVSGLLAGAEFRSSRRNCDKQQLGFPWAEIYLSSIVTRAFEKHAVKPINITVLKCFKKDISALLYPKLDYYLSNHTEVEMRLDNLIERLGLTGEQLLQPSYRRRKFEPIAEELTGQPLSSRGYVIDAKIEKTADGDDHKLVARRRRK